MKIIKQTYLINSSIEDVWQALVDPKYINAWGGGPAKMADKVGTKFAGRQGLSKIYRNIYKTCSKIFVTL